MRTSAAVLLLLVHLGLSADSVTRATNEFASQLYQVLSNQPGNILVCPFSAHGALTLVHQGAAGNTARELATALRLTGNNNDIKERYKYLLSSIQGKALTMANKLFPADNFKINPNYIRLAQEYFRSDLENLNYRDPGGAATKINKYVEMKTNNRIHGLISPENLSEATKLVIVNAVHFKASWKRAFPSTFQSVFKVTPQRKSNAQMMNVVGQFGYKEDPALSAQLLKLDYKEGDYSMLIILPYHENGLTALEAKLAKINLEAVVNSLAPAEINVTIPKFQLEQTTNLKDAVGKLGVKQLFSSNAELHNVASGSGLYVSQIVQKTFISVDEEGTEAAAATGVELVDKIRPESEYTPPNFTADHPFFFALLHKSNAVLFLGRLLHT